MEAVISGVNAIAISLDSYDAQDYRVRDLAPTGSGGLLSLLMGAGVRDAFRGVGREIAAGLREELSGASAARPAAQ